MSYTYKYPHPAVTADCVVFAQEGSELYVLLIERGNDPYKGHWAFPGGFMNMDETAEECARRRNGIGSDFYQANRRFHQSGPRPAREGDFGGVLCFFGDERGKGKR